MFEDRIGHLRLSIRTDLADAAAIRPAAERMVREALERCAALLEQRAPGRVVLMRSLPLRWRLDESMLEDAVEVDQLARWAADLVERTATPYSPIAPAAPDGAVVFDDEPHFRAAQLLALARGRSAWFPAVPEMSGEGDALAALAAPERRATAHATLTRLARDRALADVLAAQPAPAVAVLAAALGCTGAAVSTAAPPDGPAAETAALAGRLAAMTSDWPALTEPARLLALRVHAAVLLDAEFGAPEAVALAAAVFASPPVVPSAPLGELADVSLPFPESAKEPLPQDRPPPPDVVRGAAGDSAEAAAGFAITRCAGLFYLLDRVQELDLAESLWKACLPEGAVLAAAAAALLGPEFAGDAAPALFGGLEEIVGCADEGSASFAIDAPFDKLEDRLRTSAHPTALAGPEVAPEQHEEVAIATAAALAAALPRRGLADLPPVFLALADHPAGRLLVAAAEGSPFAFFAWPAPTPGGLEAGLRAFLAVWPHRGTVSAGPPLAALDGSGRLRPDPGAGAERLFLPDAPSAPAAALLALAAGASGLLFAARTGAPSPDTAPAFVARYLARPARIRLAPERMDILLDADDIDFDLRRAGLDRDPGWLPWLRRNVRFVFEGREMAEESPTGGEFL